MWGAGGEKHGVIIWSDMRIMRVVWTVGNATSEQGAVIDLKIQIGKILARVQGTRKTPYKVEIWISPLSEERCQSIILICGRKLRI